jgi:hypothetical protein
VNGPLDIMDEATLGAGSRMSKRVPITRKATAVAIDNDKDETL